MTPPADDPVRHAQAELDFAAKSFTQAGELEIPIAERKGILAQYNAARDAFRDALLDAIESDVAGMPRQLAGSHPHFVGYIHEDDVRAAIRARRGAGT